MILLMLVFCIIYTISITIFFRIKFNKNCIVLHGILDEIISKSPITYPDTKDNVISKIAHQSRCIEEMINYEVNQSKAENESIKSLITDMSHQLKTPLANIIMYVELLESEDLDNKKKKDFMSKIKLQTSKINWIVTSLIKMSRLEHNIINFDISPNYIKETLVESISTVFIKAMEKNIKINLMPFEDKLLLHNRRWTVEAIVNVFENAIKYSEENTTITISIEELQLYTVIKIVDEGIGIKESEYNKIFSRFYRSKDVEDKDGTGIGLYLTRLILEKEQGAISVKSKINKGSCFRILLQNCKI